MGVIPIHDKRPTFLAASVKDIKFKKYMFIRKNGEAHTLLGDNISRNCYEAELICVSNEDDNYWVGNYAEGYGFFGIRFLKSDCKEATEQEISNWFDDRNSVSF